MTDVADGAPSVCSALTSTRLDMDETVDRIMALIEQRCPSSTWWSTPPRSSCFRDDERRCAMSSAPALLSMPTGSRSSWASRLLRTAPAGTGGRHRPVRAAGRTAAEDGRSRLLPRRARRGAPRDGEQCSSSRYPDLRVAGYRNGYWDDDAEVVDAGPRRRSPTSCSSPSRARARSSGSAEHLAALGVPFVMGVGGSFDVIAGKVGRAPRWVQRIGLRVGCPARSGAASDVEAIPRRQHVRSFGSRSANCVEEPMRARQRS